MSLGENIYKLRTGKRMSQEDFAAAMEVSRQSVSKWENNMAVPELEKLIKIAKLFEVSLDELVGNASSQPAPQKTEPIPAPIPGITTGDLISIVLLFLAIIAPILVLITEEIHNSFYLFFGSIFVVPPAATFAASKCSPKNKTMRNAYLVFDLIMAFIVLIFCGGALYLGLFLSFLFLIPIFRWPTDSE